MTISEDSLNALLQEEDIEGFINLGAPSDEYLSEATNIATAISLLKKDEVTKDNITALITLEWMQSFNLLESDMESRKYAIQRIAKSIIENT